MLMKSSQKTQPKPRIVYRKTACGHHHIYYKEILDKPFGVRVNSRARGRQQKNFATLHEAIAYRDALIRWILENENGG